MAELQETHDLVEEFKKMLEHECGSTCDRVEVEAVGGLETCRDRSTGLGEAAV